MSHRVIIKNAVKKYGNFTALNGVSLDIKQGEFFTLLGPSGCGKTTLLRMIAGFNTVDGGEICFDDKVINGLEAHKRDIGMVFQNYAIFPHLTVAENVAYGLKARKYPKEKIPAKVDEALDLVQIKNLRDRKPNELSGGQQQRVALARAFVVEPGVLLMDEPLSNLDAKLRVQMRTVIKKLQRRLGITTIYVTHDQEEALTMSDRIAVMHDGILDQLGTPEEIYEQPRTKFVATFIGETNIFEGNIKELAMGRVAVRIENGVIRGCGYGFSRNEYITVSVRPEKMKFSAAPVKGFQLEAQVKDYVYAGSVVKCIAVLQNGMEIKMDRLAGEELPEPGSIIHPWWEEKDAVLLHNPENQVLKMIDSMPLI